MDRAVVKDGQLDRGATKFVVEAAVLAKTAELASYSQEGLGLGETATGPGNGKNIPTLEMSEERLAKALSAFGYGGDGHGA